MNIQELKDAFGAYFRNEGQGLKDFHSSFFQPIVTERYFGSRPTLNTQERKVKTGIGQVLRKWQKAITAEESLEMLPRSIDLQKLSYEVRDTPDEIEDSYAGFMSSPDSNDKRTWTIVQYIINELMLNKGRQEMELNEIYKGVASPIVPGTANPPGENFDGLEFLMNNLITDGKISPVQGPTTWDENPKNMVAELKEWVSLVKASDNEARLLLESNQIDYVFMSPHLVERLAEGVFEKYSINYNAANIDIMKTPLEVRLPFSNLTAVGLPSMAGRERVFMSPKNNRAAFIKRPISEGAPHIQEQGREVVIFSDYWKGIGFWHPEYVYTTDHEVPEEED
jgi:hypothetical protein